MLTGILAGLAAGALWGLVFVAPRMVSGFPAVDFTAGRFLSYGAVSLFLMLAVRKSAWPNARQALAALGMSVLGFTGYYLLLVFAIRDAGTEVPSLIIGTIPVWMMLLGKPAGLRLGALVPGLVLTLLGLGLMTQASHGAGATAGEAVPHLDFWRGVVFAVASMVFWTVFGLVNAAWLKKHPEVSATTWANWLGVATGLGALALWLAAGSDAKVLLARTDWAQAAMLCMATGFGSTWLATILWNIASRRLSASLCGQLIVSETLFALAYSFAWDGRWPTQVQALACLLFAAGILASIRAHR
ncbi:MULTISPECIES: DMT family transporter [Polaromonas]|uniref:DMT family transporter n=1 Tax=Polaromonas aquatica TaxID=332657 RepID=A0ABW1TRK6_9BURK